MQEKQELSSEEPLNIKLPRLTQEESEERLNRALPPLTEVDMRGIPSIPEGVATTILASYLEPGDCVALTQKFPGLFDKNFKEQGQGLILDCVLKRNLKGLATYLSTAQRLGITGSSLFLQKARATDYSGHQFAEISPLQAAFLRHDPQMAEILLKHIDLRNPGQAAICAAQLKAIGLMPTYESLPECDYDFEQLATAISGSSPTDLAAVLAFDWRRKAYAPVCALDGTLKAFRADFSAKKFNDTAFATPQARIIHYWFNPKPLIKALEVYAAHWNNWSANKCRVFWRLVLGYLKRHLPASYAQAICDGLVNVVENSRSLNWGFAADGIHYYPLGAGAAGDGLGFDFSWYSGGAGWCSGGAEDAASAAHRLKSFVEQTLSHLAALHNKYCLLAQNPMLPEDSLVASSSKRSPY